MKHLLIFWVKFFFLIFFLYLFSNPLPLLLQSFKSSLIFYFAILVFPFLLFQAIFDRHLQLLHFLGVILVFSLGPLNDIVKFFWPRLSCLFLSVDELWIIGMVLEFSTGLVKVVFVWNWWVILFYWLLFVFLHKLFYCTKLSHQLSAGKISPMRLRWKFRLPSLFFNWNLWRLARTLFRLAWKLSQKFFKDFLFSPLIFNILLIFLHPFPNFIYLCSVLFGLRM